LGQERGVHPPLPSEKLLATTPKMKFKVSGKEPIYRADIPSRQWLHDKQSYARSNEVNEWGVPYHTSSMTGSFWQLGKVFSESATPIIPLAMLDNVKGVRGEQDRLSLKYKMDSIKEGIKEGVEFPPPFVVVNQYGDAHINEGNHRIMAARELGLKEIPVELKYFDGGELVDGPWHPEKVLGRSLDERDHEVAFHHESGPEAYVSLKKNPLPTKMQLLAKIIRRNEKFDVDMYPPSEKLLATTPVKAPPLVDHTESANIGELGFILRGGKTLETIGIPGSSSEKWGSAVPRHMYHSRRGSQPFSGGIAASPIAKEGEREILQDYKDGHPEDKVVWLGPERWGSPEETYLIDLSKLDVSQLRATGQAEGNVVYRGDIPASAIEPLASTPVKAPEEQLGLFEEAAQIKPQQLTAGSLFDEKKGRKLLIVGCCKTKSKVEGRIPASERYKGTLFATLNAAGVPKDVDVAVLSAKHGLIRFDTPLEDYNVKMKDGRKDLLKSPEQLARINNTVDGYGEVFVAGGEDYRNFLDEAGIEGKYTTYKDLKANVRGIGDQRSILAKWLKREKVEEPKPESKKVEELRPGERVSIKGKAGVFYLDRPLPNGWLRIRDDEQPNPRFIKVRKEDVSSAGYYYAGGGGVNSLAETARNMTRYAGGGGVNSLSGTARSMFV
jgi:hypothetical protein